jgi:hypothetical protein
VSGGPIPPAPLRRAHLVAAHARQQRVQPPQQQLALVHAQAPAQRQQRLEGRQQLLSPQQRQLLHRRPLQLLQQLGRRAGGQLPQRAQHAG